MKLNVSRKLQKKERNVSTNHLGGFVNFFRSLVTVFCFSGKVSHSGKSHMAARNVGRRSFIICLLLTLRSHDGMGGNEQSNRTPRN